MSKHPTRLEWTQPLFCKQQQKAVLLRQQELNPICQQFSHHSLRPCAICPVKISRSRVMMSVVCQAISLKACLWLEESSWRLPKIKQLGCVVVICRSQRLFASQLDNISVKWVRIILVWMSLLVLGISLFFKLHWMCAMSSQSYTACRDVCARSFPFCPEVTLTDAFLRA